jgi:hypothetical protein
MKMMIEDFKSDIHFIRHGAYSGIEQLTNMEIIDYFDILAFQLVKKYNLTFVKNVECDSDNSES